MTPSRSSGTVAAFARARHVVCVRRRHQVARLILAEPECVSGDAGGAASTAPILAGHRHFGERDEKAAVGDVVCRGNNAVADQRPDEFAVAPLGGEIDRRRRALLPPANIAQINRLAEPALVSPTSRIAWPSALNASVIDLVKSSSRPTPPIVGVGRIARPLVSL